MENLTRLRTATLRHVAVASIAGAVVSATPALAQDANTPTPPAGYALTPSFTEVFSGTKLNTTTWTNVYASRSVVHPSITTRNLWGNGEKEVYFDPAYLGLGITPFTVSNGTLTITAAQLSASTKAEVAADLARNGGAMSSNSVLKSVEYSSGLISSRGSFAQQYGYFEVRARWSYGKGLWPAFWMLPANGGWPPEIDAMEALGNATRTIVQSSHSFYAPTSQSHAITIAASGTGQQFHRYGVLWQPGRLDYYVDGVKTSTLPTSADMTQPMYMLVNLAIGGYWPGIPDATVKFPVQMQVSYVRAWKFTKLP